jgi:aspartate/methionine/tyrosine aminotransferase
MRDFALEVHFSRWEFAAKYNMTASDAESLTLRDLLAYASPADREAYEKQWLGYTETFGSPVLREEIAQTYDTVKPEHLLTFAGAEEAIYVLSRVLLEPGDHAVVITPNYQAAETLPLSICEVTGVPLEIDRGWDLDVERLRDAIRPNTKLVSINFPNNPTGRIVPRSSLDAIVEICADQGIWLFSDEVYRLIERDPALRLPQAVDLYPRAISLNVLSKAYGLPGLRIGWLACKDRSLLVRCERYKHYLSICNSAPSEALAVIALRARDKVLERNRGIVRQNVAALDAFFSRHADLFDWKAPDGGCVAFIRYKGEDGVESFTTRLVEEAGVLFLPARIFASEVGDVPDDCFRVGFGRAHVREALGVFEAWLVKERATGRVRPRATATAL